jgi:hypothetical protein
LKCSVTRLVRPTVAVDGAALPRPRCLAGGLRFHHTLAIDPQDFHESPVRLPEPHPALGHDVTLMDRAKPLDQIRAERALGDMMESWATRAGSFPSQTYRCHYFERCLASRKDVTFFPSWPAHSDRR